MNKKELIIIGGGLSGLYLTTLLQNKFNVTLLEARQRLGGRVLTLEGHDMGPSWVWQHQSHILALIQELGLELFGQHTQGDALYDAPEGVQRFQNPPSGPSARMQGGLQQLIQALAKQIDSAQIILDQEVGHIEEIGARLRLSTQDKSYEADYIISTLPPRVAAQNITYQPPLPQVVETTLTNTPTWMGHTAKCVMTFERPFWREADLSGFCFSHLGPLGEIHDATTAQEPALFGFLHQKANLQHFEAELKAQLQRLFGDNAKQLKKVHFVDWREEPHTATAQDKKGLTTHPNYGLNLTHFNHHLIFSGTESAFDNGGYLEGAVIAAKEVAERLLNDK